MEEKKIEISIILPCLNEASGIEICIEKIREVFNKSYLRGEIIVVDNGSTDNSGRIAENLGAKVIFQNINGYGAACRLGIQNAKANYIIMGDADDSYNFLEIPKFIKLLQKGFDLVIGSRFKGKILKGSMPWAHRYIGNPILSGLLNVYYNSRISDVHCGMRAFTKSAYEKMNLQTTGMEFASEMIVRALQAKLKITEIPINYHPRKGKSKLQSFPDAWRHIRFILLFSPNYFFFLPGMAMLFLGILIVFAFMSGITKFASRTFDIHMLIFGSSLVILGFQIMNIWIFAKTYALAQNFISNDKYFKHFPKKFNLEKGIILGLIMFLTGFLINMYIFYKWISVNFGVLNMVKPALFGLTFMVLGIQTIFSSFFHQFIKNKG